MNNISNISVVLVRPAISGNVGAVARAMANFGFSNLVIVEPKCKIDEEARNRAKHAQKILDNIKFEKSLKQALSKFSTAIATTGVLGSDYNIVRSPLLVEDASKKISSSNGNIALVFGAEDTGLSNEELALCDYTATIPSSREYPVLNLSHAVTVFLYELSKQNSKQNNSESIKKDFPLITGREKEALEKSMDSVIESVSYRTVFEKRTQKLVWKRILGKAMPTRREAFAMIGLLKKLANKKENNKNKEKQKSKEKQKLTTKRDKIKKTRK